MDYLRAHQLDVMLFMCGMCGILAVMTMITRSLPRKTRHILSAMELSAMMLLFFDRFSYIFRGDESALGYRMVRIGNGLVYFFLLLIPFLVTRYLIDMLISEGGFRKPPKLLVLSELLFAVGIVLVLVSQFTGMYYTFDEHNFYQRGRWHALCYVVPFLIVLLQEWTIIKYRGRINRRLVVSMIVCLALPTVSSVLQIFAYGLSLTNMTTALVVCVFYSYALNYLSEAAERARAHELEYYKKAQKKEAALFEQTTEALANAIDAKDRYTRGHSARVARYSKQIAKEAGLSDDVCEQVFFAALLHDVGKIGVSTHIINKAGSLTEDEFAQVKDHPLLGARILSSIRQAPFLGDGARYHHERYDGGGYPDGLSGKEIPETARIIAVADAYDAMTSYRSYREPLKKEAVIEELKKGRGTQFDPEFVDIMLRIIGRDGSLQSPE